MAWMLEVEVAGERAFMAWDLVGGLEGHPEVWQVRARDRMADGRPIYPNPTGPPLVIEADRAAAATLDTGPVVWGGAAWNAADLTWSGEEPLTDPSYWEVPKDVIT